VTIWYGGDYSPEQWDAPVWAEDDQLMRRAHVTTATVGVFSWALLEPEEGRFDFGWLDDTLDRLHANAVRVILATPTASPPPWFTLAHPDAMPVTRDGSRLWHGSRDTYCAAAPAYRRAALRIAAELARRYADHPALAMWHVHNEYGTRCWCDHAAVAFRSWLRCRYRDLAVLNQAWGTAFWGQRYSAWEQILPPRGTQYLPNPGQELDFRRFWSDELLAAYREQRDVLRASAVPVTTNFMGPDHVVLDAWSWGPEVDVVALDHYLATTGPAGYADIAFCSSWARAAGRGRPWLLMEQAPSTVRQDGILTHRAPGRMARDSLSYVAYGADSVLFFQWRASPAGAEQWHPALVPHAGPDTRMFAEAVALGSLLDRIGETAGSVLSPSPAAVLYDTAARWALETRDLPSPFVSHVELARAMHASMLRTGTVCDLAPPAPSLGPYQLVIVPAVYLMSPATAESLRRFTEAGGHLVVTFGSGIADESHHIYPGGYPGALRDLLGIRVEEFHPLPPGDTIPLDPGPPTPAGAAGSLWTELVHADGAEVVARYASGVLAGRPAITRVVRGQGAAWYLSTLPDERALDALLHTAAEAAGVQPLLPGVPPGVVVTRRHAPDGRSWLFAINNTGAPATLPVTGTDLLTGRTASGALDIAPGSCAVVRDVLP
jgi:beta-galactosidase